MGEFNLSKLPPKCLPAIPMPKQKSKSYKLVPNKLSPVQVQKESPLNQQMSSHLTFGNPTILQDPTSFSEPNNQRTQKSHNSLS